MGPCPPLGVKRRADRFGVSDLNLGEDAVLVSFIRLVAPAACGCAHALTLDASNQAFVRRELLCLPRAYQ